MRRAPTVSISSRCWKAEAEIDFQNVLVTGGAGFIGANFVRHLLEHFPEVRVVTLDLLTYAGSLDNLRDLAAPSRHHFVQGDVGDGVLVARLLEQHQLDTIVHFAAESHVDRSIATPEAFVHTNVLGTFTLLHAAYQRWIAEEGRCERTCRFHQVSTDEVFGSLGDQEPAFTESSLYRPNSPYSASKAGADHLARAYFHTYRLPVTTSHCSNNYGPRQHSEKFLPTVIRSCLRGEPIPVYGSGLNVRDWLHVDDHCEGLAAILQRGRPGETYNLGGCNEMSNLQLAQTVCALMDEMLPRPTPHAELIRFVEDRAGHDWRYAVAVDKAAEELGWRPRQDFRDGLRQTIAWYVYESPSPGGRRDGGLPPPPYLGNV